jgi:hypothetical protein
MNNNRTQKSPIPSHSFSFWGIHNVPTEDGRAIVYHLLPGVWLVKRWLEASRRFTPRRPVTAAEGMRLIVAGRRIEAARKMPPSA